MTTLEIKTFNTCSVSTILTYCDQLFVNVLSTGVIGYRRSPTKIPSGAVPHANWYPFRTAGTWWQLHPSAERWSPRRRREQRFRRREEIHPDGSPPAERLWRMLLSKITKSLRRLPTSTFCRNCFERLNKRVHRQRRTLCGFVAATGWLRRIRSLYVMRSRYLRPLILWMRGVRTLSLKYYYCS